MTEREGTAVAKTDRDTSSQEAQPLMVSPHYIQQTRQSLGLLRTLTKQVLVKDRDYGRVPGIQWEFLWDPGASQIIGAFSCHNGPRRLLNLVDDGQKIAVIIEVPIISNTTGQEVGNGIGAASTQEAKHKYRWESNPRDWGLDDEAAKTLKTRDRYGKMEYRIPNPEHGELLNIMVKQASKRAEVDAAEGLPGVASALKELFSGRTQPQRKEPDWSSFWGRVAQMGISETRVHELLEVQSVTEWVEKGGTLDSAIRTIAAKLGNEAAAAPPEPMVTGHEPTNVQELLGWVLSHGNTYTRSWVLVTSGCTEEELVKNPVGIYHTLKELMGWGD